MSTKIDRVKLKTDIDVLEDATDVNTVGVAGTPVPVNTSVIRSFTQRNQELTDVIRRMSNGSVIDDEVTAEFSHELANYHCVAVKTLISHFATSSTTGLDNNQAQQILAKNGRNELPKSKELPIIVQFLLCFVNGFSPLLWIAFVFVFITYIPFGTPPSNIYNLALAIALLIVIFLSGIFTFIQEVSSSIALAAFSNLIPPNCIVIREGKSQTISPLYLAVGDLVVLETGMRVPSDVRVIVANDLKIDKSMLTGENEPVKLFSSAVLPSTPMLEAKNIAFMGCNVVEGQGLGIVIATGKKNQLSKISDQVGRVATSFTSLQVDLNWFVAFIGTAALVTAVTCVLEWKFYLDVQHNGFMTLDSMICNAISVLVAFVPEGLPLALQTGLTIIANRLCLQHQVLIKKLSIIETVGSMTLLASDKTGTLTQNKMTVSSLITSSFIKSVDELQATHQATLGSVLVVAIQCNQAKLEHDDRSGLRTAVGSNGIDKALLNWAESRNVVDNIKDTTNVALLIPFSSATKITIAVVEVDNCFYVTAKGAPEYILDRCESYLDEVTKSVKPMTTDVKSLILNNISIAASTGKRVIAIAHLPLLSSSYSSNYTFLSDPSPNFPVTGLTFLACIAVSDPPREGVSEAITILRTAGISVCMITGDASNTAIAIAKQVGILSSQDNDNHPFDTLRQFLDEEQKYIHDDIESSLKLSSSPSSSKKKSIELTSSSSSLIRSSSIIIDGHDLETITPSGWTYVFSHQELVFARTTPDQKLQIVMESQKRGFRVGVTGDGVNDSPALKRADVGISMGKSGSDVAKDASDIILLNDDFSSIPKAVLEGRLIFINLRKVIAYQIAAGCWSELIPVLATFFIGMPQPLSSFLMIIISCSTDVLAGICLMNEPPESSLITDKPRNIKTSSLVNWKLISYSYLYYGSLNSVGSFLNYFLYMAERGNTRELPNPLPADDEVTSTLNTPFGYRADQLMYAWNWETSSSTNTLYKDQVQAAAVASSVFFVTLVVCQMGHLLNIRKKTPYFSEVYTGTHGTVWTRLYEKIVSIRPIWRVILSWCGSVIIANIFNEVPAVQVACGTGSVPGRYWGIAIGWSALVFSIDQIRKWIVLVYPDSFLTKISWEFSE